MVTEDGEGSGGSQKPDTAATSTAPDSSTQQSPAPQEHTPTRSPPVHSLEDAMSGRRSESAPRVPASDVRLQGAADTAPIEEAEGSQQTLPTETSPASGSTSTTLALAGSSPTPQGQETTRTEDALGGRSIESAPRVPASDVLLRGRGFIFQAPRDQAPDQPARASLVFVPGGDDIDIAHVKTQLPEQLAGIASSASDSKTPPASDSDSTTLALTQSPPAQQEHGTTSSPPVHVPADAISGRRSESALLPGPSISIEALFGPPPASLLPRRDVGVIGGGRPARAAAGDPEMGLVPLRGHAPHAGMPLLRQPEPEVTTMVRMAPRTLGVPLRSAGLLQWHEHAPHVGGAPFVQLEPGHTRMTGTGLQWTTGQPWRQHVGPGLAGAQLQLHQARSPLRLEMLWEQPRPHGRHHLALAPTRRDNSENILQIPREDVQRGWAELQARRRECEELRRNNYLLQMECWDLHQALRLHRTPPSSSGSCVAGERHSEPCAGCSGPAKVSMKLCVPCYQRRQDCPCCRGRFDLY